MALFKIILFMTIYLIGVPIAIYIIARDNAKMYDEWDRLDPAFATLSWVFVFIWAFGYFIKLIVKPFKEFYDRTFNKYINK